jgi:hypothetical protein
VRSLVQKYGAESLHGAVAVQRIQDLHRRTGLAYGDLGVPAGPVLRDADGSYNQDYQIGKIHLNDFDGVPSADRKVKVRVSLTAVKCFGTEDPGGSDETFVIISVININANFDGTDKLVTTMRTEIKNGVQGGDVIFEARTVGPEVGLGFPGGGLKINVAIFDHEHGDVDELREKIQAFLEDAARKGSQALAGAAAAGNPSLAGVAGGAQDFMNFEVGGVKPFRLLTLTLSDELAEALADDLVDEHEFVIPAVTLAGWAKQAPDDPDRFPEWERSFRRSADLPRRIQFNWPPADDEYLFSGGGGSYKVYLTLTPILTIEPVVPKVP